MELTRRFLPLVEAVGIPVMALLVAMLLFAGFVAAVGQSPLEVFALLYKGAFGSAFSWQNTLLRAAPLILTGLAVAIPAQAGMVIIGGEGALALGALTAAVAASALQGAPPHWVQTGMLAAGALCGGLWIGLSGWLRQYRGVNETIGSLLLSYIGIALLNFFVEGPLKDPASLNKPSTAPIGDANMIGNLPGMDVHYGLLFGVIFALVTWVILKFTTLGFALKTVGGNPRAAQMAGLRVGYWIVGAAFAGGAAAGLAGAIEVAAVQGAANASVVAGYGYAGILVAFIARQNPFAVIPVAVLIGGINAAGGMLQRRLDMPDASVLVLQGIIFVVIIASETLNGRLGLIKFKSLSPVSATISSKT
ncbi:ABC transporter permease [Sulfuriferula thiophila]|uniref:ABC transporter permease n=1 Tax=Sulfuriferula thiophila TaxID=1781211 RepID=UPI000F60D90E|nr:ABC transporter permease [Sulfuriferula thiophila]